MIVKSYNDFEYYVLMQMMYYQYLILDLIQVGVIIDNKLRWNDHITYVKKYNFEIFSHSLQN